MMAPLTTRLLAIFAMLLLTLAACGPSDETQEASDNDVDDASANDVAETPHDEESEQITLRYFHWDPAEEQTELDVIADFEEAHPNITVEFVATGTPEYWTQAEALAASGDLPDVMVMSAGFVEEWREDGLILNLQQYVDEHIDKDNYFMDVAEVARDPETQDLYAFPFAMVATVMYYNVDAFRDAGLEEPSWEEGWTWDEFLEAADALTTDDRYGHYLYGRYTNIEPWIYQNAGRILTEDRQAVEPDDNAVETLHFLNGLIHEHGVAPLPKEMEGIEDEEVFGTGLSAMWVDGIWKIAGLRDVIGEEFEWRIAPLPRGPSWEDDTAYGWPDLLAIPTDSEHPDEAWLLIDWLTGANRSADNVPTGKLPFYIPTAEDPAVTEPGLPPDNQDEVIGWAENAGPTNFTPGWDEWRGYTGGSGMQALLDEAFNGRMSMDEAIAETVEHANQILERSRQ